jgi:hypothetical protein
LSLAYRKAPQLSWNIHGRTHQQTDHNVRHCFEALGDGLAHFDSGQFFTVPIIALLIVIPMGDISGYLTFTWTKHVPYQETSFAVSLIVSNDSSSCNVSDEIACSDERTQRNVDRKSREKLTL